MDRIIIKDNEVYFLTEISISKIKELLLNLECKYKLKNVFIEKFFNESFAILTMETFYLMLVSISKNEFIDFNFETDITFKEDNIFVKFKINKMYNNDFTKLTKEQLEFIFKNIDEAEKFVIENLINKFPNTENILEKLDLFFKTILDFNEIIKNIKNNIPENLDKKEQLSFINFSLLKELFGNNFIVIITKNKLLSEEDYEYRG